MYRREENELLLAPLEVVDARDLEPLPLLGRQAHARRLALSAAPTDGTGTGTGTGRRARTRRRAAPPLCLWAAQARRRRAPLAPQLPQQPLGSSTFQAAVRNQSPGSSGVRARQHMPGTGTGTDWPACGVPTAAQTPAHDPAHCLQTSASAAVFPRAQSTVESRRGARLSAARQHRQGARPVSHRHRG